MKDLTIEEVAAKYANIEDKIPSVWSTWEEAGVNLAQDMYNKWDVSDGELIRVISLMGIMVKGMKLYDHINPMFSFTGLYPHVQRTYNIQPDSIKS